MIVHELNRQGVRRVTYDAASSEMRIEFFRGQVYAYDAVPEAIVQWLVRTKDPAGYIQRVITPGFVYRKLSSPRAVNASLDDAQLEATLRASLASLGRDPGSNTSRT